MIDSFNGEHRFLSNFYLCEVEYQGVKYPSAEHAFQAAKCWDVLKRDQFLVGSPGQAKRLGRRVRLRSDWEQVKYRIMAEVVLAKFMQNPELKEKLFATEGEELIEGNTWNDTYWGVCRGRCENKLGGILMRIRDWLLFGIHEDWVENVFTGEEQY